METGTRLNVVDLSLTRSALLINIKTAFVTTFKDSTNLFAHFTPCNAFLRSL